MYRENALKKRLASRERVLGCWLHMASPIAAEVVALAGYDFVIIDHEHGPGHMLDATNILRAVAGTPATALMRVPSFQRSGLPHARARYRD